MAKVRWNIADIPTGENGIPVLEPGTYAIVVDRVSQPYEHDPWDITVDAHYDGPLPENTRRTLVRGDEDTDE